MANVEEETKCKSLLERIARSLGFELFPEKAAWSGDPIWILRDYKDCRRFLGFPSWGGWEFARLEKMLEEFMKSGERLFLCTDCGQVPGKELLLNPFFGTRSIEELEMKLVLLGA